MSADKGARFVTVITAALAVGNVGIAFLVGVAADWLLTIPSNRLQRAQG